MRAEIFCICFEDILMNKYFDFINCEMTNLNRNSIKIQYDSTEQKFVLSCSHMDV